MTIGSFSGVVCAARPVVPDVITLSGTTGSPNTFADSVVSPTDAEAEWEFRADGSVWKTGFSPGQFLAGTEWCQQDPVDAYWIRFTLNAGNSPDVGTLGSWLSLATARAVAWVITGTGTSAGSVKVEISSDSSGTPIVATGYYGGTATVEP